MKRFVLLSIVGAFLILTACACDDGAAAQTEEIDTFQLSPSQEGVTEFLEKLEEPPLSYDNDTCFNVTPREIAEKYGFEVFKFDQSCAGYLLYNGCIHPLGEWFGGSGLVSFAVADMNSDGTEELYFTYSWGSGMHRSLAGYFDFASDEPVLFEYANYGSDMILVAEGGALALHNAHIDAFSSFVEIHAEADDKVAEVLYESGAITLREIDAS